MFGKIRRFWQIKMEEWLLERKVATLRKTRRAPNTFWLSDEAAFVIDMKYTGSLRKAFDRQIKRLWFGSNPDPVQLRRDIDMARLVNPKQLDGLLYLARVAHVSLNPDPQAQTQDGQSPAPQPQPAQPQAQSEQPSPAPQFVPAASIPSQQQAVGATGGQGGGARVHHPTQPLLKLTHDQTIAAVLTQFNTGELPDRQPDTLKNRAHSLGVWAAITFGTGNRAHQIATRTIDAIRRGAMDEIQFDSPGEEFSALVAQARARINQYGVGVAPSRSHS